MALTIEMQFISSSSLFPGIAGQTSQAHKDVFAGCSAVGTAAPVLRPEGRSKDPASLYQQCVDDVYPCLGECLYNLPKLSDWRNAKTDTKTDTNEKTCKTKYPLERGFVNNAVPWTLAGKPSRIR
jgi:hypothetical protein